MHIYIIFDPTRRQDRLVIDQQSLIDEDFPSQHWEERIKHLSHRCFMARYSNMGKHITRCQAHVVAKEPQIALVLI